MEKVCLRIDQVAALLLARDLINSRVFFVATQLPNTLIGFGPSLALADVSAKSHKHHLRVGGQSKHLNGSSFASSSFSACNATMSRLSGGCNQSASLEAAHGIKVAKFNAP